MRLEALGIPLRDPAMRECQAFLRDVSDAEWWMAGREPPGEAS